MTIRFKHGLLTLPLLAFGCDMDLFGKNDDNGGGEVEIRFDARIGDATAECGPKFILGSTGDEVSLRDLRFYVSNVRLIDADGEEVPLELEDNSWQNSGAALLDFENASVRCSNNTTEAMNTSIVGRAPSGDYEGIVFDVGLPFELNHQDPATAEPPFDSSAMFWTWASGYKYVKIDVSNSANQLWSFHLGARGCRSNTAEEPPSMCSRPLVPEIRLDGFDPENNIVVFDVGQLFADVDVTTDTPDTAPGCQSFEPDVNECRPMITKLGLEWDSGVCFAGCREQTVFRVE